MKKNTVTGLLLLALGLGTSLIASAQTPAQRDAISKTVNRAKLEEIAQISKQRTAKAYELAKINNWPLRKIENGVEAVLMGVTDDGFPVYKGNSNLGSARTSRVLALRPGGDMGLELTGEGMVIGMWEISHPRASHNDFGGRVDIIDGSFPGSNDSSFHATHVAGTLVGSGQGNPEARGMAYEAELLAYDSESDLPEAINEVEDGLLISNHSYGWIFEAAPAWMRGAYDDEAFRWDELMYNAPYYQHVVAAGNDRNNEERDELLGLATSKNAIVVGASLQVNNYNPNNPNVGMSSFSTYGPTDDLRIKPDIVTKGVDVFSTTSESNSAYGFSQGTSMASPGIAGTLTLLQEHYRDFHEGEEIPFMRAATLKGLMTHTADEANSIPGPDYKYGWGLINATRAAQVIIDAHQVEQPTALIEENLMTGAVATYTKTVTISGAEPLKATIAWSDAVAESTVNTGTPNDTDPVLVNDLDLRIFRNMGQEDEEEFLPWKLTSSISQPAIKGDNDRDNVEVVEIQTPVAGTYTIVVTYKDILFDNEDQPYSLIVSGITDATTGVVEEVLVNKLSIYPNPATDVINMAIDPSVDTSNTSVVLYDLQGRQVKQAAEFVNKIDVSDLSAGVYMLNVKIGAETVSKKIVIK